MGGRIDLQDRTGPLLDALQERVLDLKILRASCGEAVLTREGLTRRVTLRELSGGLTIRWGDQLVCSSNERWVLDKVVELLGR